MFYQIISVVGAVMILASYGLSQSGKTRPTDPSYVFMNFVGATLLTWVAIVDHRVGFIVLEGSWALLSLMPLAHRATSHT